MTRKNGRKPRNAKGSGGSGSSGSGSSGSGSGSSSSSSGGGGGGSGIYGSGSSSSGKGKGDGEGSRICVLLVSPWNKQMNLVAIDTAGGELRMEQLSTLQNDVSTDCVGLTALGSKAYAIGGNVDRVTLRYPKRVYTYNFNKHSKQQWEEGPTLNGGKPDPVVVTLDHKIYALAGISFRDETISEKLDPVFEFLDPYGSNVWTRLPDPPFISLYRIQDRYSNGVKFRGHTAIGFNIYVQVVEPSGSICLYSFNVKKKKWTSHNTSSNNGDDREECAAAGSDGLIFDNLRFAEWYGRADVVDYLLYQPFLNFVEKGMKLYAFDLTASKRDEEKIEEEGDLSDDNELLAIPDEYSFPNDDDLENYDCADSDDCVTVPVFGLNHVTDSIPSSDGSQGFVAHLRDNLFCFVGLYTSTHHFPNERLKRSVIRLRASVFELVSLEISKGSKSLKRYLLAQNVKQDDWMLDGKLSSSVFSWCKIPDKGHQIHFRRPQFQCEGKPDSYKDEVAGKVVRKQRDNNVREVNISQHSLVELRMKDPSLCKDVEHKMVIKDRAGFYVQV